jgi:hypothetical protein
MMRQAGNRFVILKMLARSGRGLGRHDRDAARRCSRGPDAMRLGIAYVAYWRGRFAECARLRLPLP